MDMDTRVRGTRWHEVEEILNWWCLGGGGGRDQSDGEEECHTLSLPVRAFACMK